MILKNILFCFLIFHFTCKSILILKTRGDPKIKNHSWAKERVLQKAVANSQIKEKVSAGLTFCFRLYLDVINSGMIVGMTDNSLKFNADANIFPRYENKNKIISIYYNGMVTNVENSQVEGLEDLHFNTRKILEDLRLGRYILQDEQWAYSFSGKITDFNAWTERLDYEHLKVWMNCVDWKTQTWVTADMDLMDESLETICHPPPLTTTLIPSRQTFWKAFQACRMFNSHMETCDSTTSDRAVVETLKQPGRGELCKSRKGLYSYWCGYTDEWEEGLWTNVNTDQYLTRSDQLWYTKPNGRELENCLVASVNLSEKTNQNITSWNDAQCSYSFCYLCRFVSTPTLRLRGLSACQRERFDYRYKWLDVLVDGKYVLQGLQGSQIVWTEFNKSWTVSNIFRTSYSTVRLTGVKSEYPAGHLAWQLSLNDECEDGPVTSKLLHLTSCGDDDFNCDDGTCVDIRSRCDLNNDCSDFSDEKNCTILIKPSSYNSYVAPPKPVNQRKNPIEIKLTILNILNIDIVQSKIKVQFKLTLSWYDSRLQYKNLKVSEYYNWFNSESDIWYPVLVFHNTETKASTVNDEKSVISILREGNNFTNSPLSSLENAHIYKGSENKLRLSRTYDLDFICNYNLFWYPFDLQSCKMNISAEDQNFLQLTHPGVIEWVGATEIDEYNFTATRVTNETFEDGEVGICVKFSFKRNIFGAIMTIYIPSTLIVFVSYLTTIFNNKQWFGHIITINLTAMLVVTTMLTSLATVLPRSKIKYIDIWLLFCLLIPVLEILLHTVEDHFNRREVKEKLIASNRKKLRLERLMTIGKKKIKVLPVEKDQHLDAEDVDGEDDTVEVEAAKLTQWVLTYIEFIGNFAILVFIITFISIYWCIGNWNIELL